MRLDIYDVYTPQLSKVPKRSSNKLQATPKTYSKELKRIFYFVFLIIWKSAWDITKKMLLEIRISNFFFGFAVQFRWFNLFLLRHEIDSPEQKKINQSLMNCRQRSKEGITGVSCRFFIFYCCSQDENCFGGLYWWQSVKWI